MKERLPLFGLTWLLLTSLFIIPAPQAFAKIQQWDFQNADEYRYDPEKITVADGVAQLKKKSGYKDYEPEGFGQGEFVRNTTANQGNLELLPQLMDRVQEKYVPAPVADNTPGLMAIWHLDETSGTNLLDPIGRNVAKASDAEVVSGTMGFNSARLFDGKKSHIFIPQYETLNFEGHFSLEAWIRPVVTAGGREQTIISRWQSIGSQKSFALQISPEGKIDFLVSTDGATTQHHTGNSVLTTGLWYHVAAVYSGEELQIYLNGVPDSEPTPFRGPVRQTGTPLYVGALIENRLAAFFEGVIDEVALYQKALTETEVMSHFGNPKAVIANWHLDETAGVLQDDSGYGNNLISREHPLYASEGKFGAAIHLDGQKQYLETPVSNLFAVNGSMTLEAWVYPDTFPGRGKATIISSYGSSADYSLSINADGQLIAGAPALEPYELVSSNVLVPKEWQHVAVSWGNGTVSLYINGLLDSRQSYKGELKSGPAGIRIGMDAKIVAPFSGSIDEVSILRRVKNDSEFSVSNHLYPSAGVYASSIKDAHSTAPWQDISWEEVAPYGEPVLNTVRGLLHSYHLDETQGELLSDSKGEIPLGFMGTYPVPGFFSMARWFEREGYAKIISQKAFPALSTFTVSLWFEFASGIPGDLDRIFSIGDENPSVYRAGPGGQIHVVSAGSRKIVSASAISNTRWHHLALSSDGRQLFLYIDGVLQGSSPFVAATAEDPLVLGNLKTSDTFKGAIDDFALFNHALDPKKIEELYQNAHQDVKFLVRSSEDASFNRVPWRGPYGFAYLEREAATNSVGLWHLNTAKDGVQSPEVKDASRSANHGAAYGNVISAADGVLSGSAQFNGASDYIEVPDSESLRLLDGMTLSAWIKPAEIQSEAAHILDKRFQKGAPTFSSFSLQLLPGNRLGLSLGHAAGFQVIATTLDGEIAAGKWNHVAATYNGDEVRLYINGILKVEKHFREELAYDEGSLFIGKNGSGDAGYFHGAMDEAGIDNRALTSDEIKDLFMRANPENYFKNPKGQPLAVAPGRYFQYLAFLSTSLPYLTPSVKSVRIRDNDFAVDLPYITNAASVSFADITRFREKTGPDHQGAITYQLSRDGSNWFYHNGRHWVVAASGVESNTAEQIATRITDFVKDVGMGSFYFKAIFHSRNGTELASLDAVEVEFLPNKLTLTSPNGAEDWLIGSEQQIRWNSAGEVVHVTLEYSRDDFKEDFNQIVSRIPNQGTFTWIIPDDPDPNVKVRVMDALDPRIYDASDLAFRIVGAFEVVSPNYNERWPVGSAQKIVWRTLGSIKAVKLDFSPDEFQKEIYPIVDSVQNSGEYEWTVPDHIARTIKVRVSDVRDPLTFDQSNDTFSIVGDIKIASPQTNERLVAGEEFPISWRNVGTLPTVRLEYQTSRDAENSEQPWKLIESAALNRGSYLWRVPDDIDSDVRVRVSDPNDKKILMVSDSFAIVGGFRWLTPKGGEHWTVGSKRKIAWETIGTIPTVTLEYALMGPEYMLASVQNPTQSGLIEWKTIEASVANIGSFIWEVPDIISDGLKIRVIDSRDPFVSAANETPVRVVPGFVLEAPSGGESWKIGSEVDIIWKTNGSIPSVRLEYSKDHFESDVHEIIGKASNVERFRWVVPDDPALEVWIRISDPSFKLASDTSDQPFRIHGDFEFLSPQGAEKFEVGSLAFIEWKTTGTIPKVKLEYSHDEFKTDARLITEAAGNTGKYNWTVPDDIGFDYYLRISDVSDPLARAETLAPFSIVGKFHLSFPAGGENLMVGTLQKITWKGAGSIRVVRIDYSEDDFLKSYQTLAEAAPNTGEFEWEVPNRIGQTFRLRIWDPAHPESMYKMDKASRIIGGFMLSAPNGGEVLYVGDKVPIAWESYGNIERVRLEFSDDQFSKHVWEIADTYQNMGRYEWQIPDLASAKYRVRISDPHDPKAFDISNSDFRIRSRFVVTNPAGGEGWKVGEKRNIEWKTSGNVANVRLEYSVDDFKTSETIADFVPNTGNYEWVVPNQVTQNLKVRVLDAVDPGAHAVSDTAMRIQGVITLAAPAGGEIWRVGQTYPISWTTVGDVKGVRIEFSRDGFVSEAELVAESTVNNGYFNWTVPDRITKNAKIRIIDLADPNARAVSQEPFQIAASFMLMGPNGGEAWHAAEKREIVWVTIGTVPEVDLQYCAADAASVRADFCEPSETKVVDKNILNTGKYVWDIPKDTGPGFRVQVCDSNYPEICDASDKTFLLGSPFEIIYPRSTESWEVGSDQEIRWQSYGAVSRVMIDYAALPLGESWDSMKMPVPWKRLYEELPNEGHFLFRVPDAISQNVVFRVSDYMDEGLFAVSPQPLKFIAKFTLLSPNGNEKWSAGSTETITWKNEGTVSNVRLEYSKDNFQKDIQLIESMLANTGSYKWTLPPDHGTAVKVRVMDADNQAVFDASDNPFKMMPAFILLSPDGGENLLAGTKHMIQWKSISEAENVNLEYLGNGEGGTKWLPIITQLPNSGSFEWLIGNDVASQKGTRIRVVASDDPDAFDVSNQPFDIHADFEMVSPRADEVLIVDQAHKIEWKTFGHVPSVKLEYGISTRGEIQPPETWEPVEAIWANNGSYYWTVPDRIHENVWLKISDVREPSAFKVSVAPFKIRGLLKLGFTEGKLNWPAGSTQTITWNTVGSISNVNLEYQLPGSTEWKTIATGVHNMGSYGWLIPSDAAKDIRVRVTDSGNPFIYDISLAAINLTARLKFLAPGAGEILAVGSEKIIRWENLGNVKNVLLEYNTGREWQPVAGPIPNTQSYSWTVPDDIAANVRLKVMDHDNYEAYTISEAFKISGVLSLASPAGKEVWPVGSEQKIVWETTGSIPKVRLELVSVEGRGDPPGRPYLIIKEDMPNQGNFSWNIPDAISDHVRIRVSDARDADAAAISADEFSIIGTLNLLSPRGGENWTVGSSQQIAWAFEGKMDAVNLEYSTDDFAQAIFQIGSNLPNTGQAVWNVPDAISGNVKVRISDAKDPRAFSQTPSPFKILGALSLSAPAGGEVWIVGSRQPLTWQTTGTIPKVGLEYSRDDFQKDIQVIENVMDNRGSYEWAIPDTIAAAVKIRIVNAEDASVRSVSNPVQITGAIHLKSLQNQELLNVFGEQAVEWETTGTIPKVRIDYSRDHFNQDIHVIVSEAENKNIFNWRIPDDIGKGVVLRVSDSRSPAVFDVSSELEIRGVLGFAEAGGRGAEASRWPVGSKQEIAWNTFGTIPFVRVEYSKDDFNQDIHLIADQLENHDKFIWTIPDDISSQIRLRVSDVRDPGVQTLSPNPYSIVGTITVTQPSGEGATAEVGSDFTLAWKNQGTIPSVRLEYATGTLQWSIIAGAVQNTGTYSWRVPDDISREVVIRVSDVRDSQVFGISTESFSIIGKLELLSPQGGERWIVGTGHDLVWKTEGTVTDVNLEFSHDHFARDFQPIALAIPNRGRYVWTVPDSISDQIDVRISDATDSRVFAVTASPISIVGDFVLIQPTSAVSWAVGSDQKIEWQTIGAIPQVKLEYLLPSANSNVIQDYVPNKGEYVWKIPDAIGEGIALRIVDARDPNTAVLSKPVIKIHGVIRLKQPEPAEILTVGSSYRLAWESEGTLPRVAIEISRDDFQLEVFAVEADHTNNNHYDWQVPDFIGERVRLRIRSLEGRDAIAASEPFQIRGKLSGLTPVGEKIFRVGEIRRLQWQTVGTIPSVNLEYSTDQFESDIKMIQPSVDNSGSFDWAVPDAIAPEVWIRVSDSRNAAVSTRLEVPVRIEGTVTLLTPAGEERMAVQSKQSVTWGHTGTIPFVDIEYSNDEFRHHRIMIAKSAANTGFLEWEVPDFIRDKVWLRISNSHDPAVFSQSENPFKIHGALDLATSRDAESWTVGQKQTIEWTATGSIGQVRIEYSTDEFESDRHVIYDAVSSQGPVQWVIPDDISDHVRLRIMDAKDPLVSSYAKTASKIHGDFEWLVPAGGEEWVVSSEETLRWKSSGSMPKVVLEYSLDGFQRDIRLIGNILANEDHFLWKIPDAIGSGVQVRVRDASDDAVFAVSAPIRIRGDIQILKPEAHEVLTVSGEKTIQWKNIGTISQVSLEYSLDEFKQDIRLIDRVANEAAAEVQSYIWRIPDAISDHVWIRIRNLQAGGEEAAVSEPFKIAGALALVSPSGGETLKVGSPLDIVWKTTGTIPSVRLEYSRDGFTKEKRSIIDSLDNLGTFNWSVSDAISERVWIRVVDVRDGAVTGICQNPFSIEGELKLKIPAGNEIWKVGSTQAIEWDTVGTIPEVRLDLVMDASSNVIANPPQADEAISKSGIASSRRDATGHLMDSYEVLTQVRQPSLPSVARTDMLSATQNTISLQPRMSNLGHYEWKIPDNLPRWVRVRLSDAANPKVFSESAAPVKIQAILKILTPVKPAEWPVGSTQEITWQSQGFLPEVKLEYSRDRFKSDIGTLYPLTANAGSVKWEVQDLISNDFQIRVADPENPEIFDVTPEPIQVTGVMKLTAPAGGERFEVGEAAEIRWRTTGAIGRVKLEYSKDKFIRHSAVMAEGVSNNGRFIWQVPDQIAQNIWLRVSDQDNPKANSVSENPFGISGVLSLISPQGGGVASVRDTIPITWDTKGKIDRVRLEFSLDDFVTATAISGLIANEGNYLWKVPDIVSERVKVRVLDGADARVFSASRSPFKIQGGLHFVHPAGGEFWKVGLQESITWQSLGTIPYVSIDYSTDNFATSVPIILGLANKNSFTWTVPDILSEQILLRISNAEDQSVFAVTAQPIRIGGVLELISPAGGEVYRVGEETEIRWKTTGTIPRVHLEISSDQFDKEIQSLGMSLENTGAYLWKVPDWIGSGFQIRVSDVRAQSVADSTRAPFKITGGFTLEAPKGGEVWRVGSAQPIIWSTNGSIPNVRLEYSSDNFLSTMPIAVETLNTGQFMWDIPDLAGRSVHLRVSDPRDPSVNAATLYAVAIQGSLEIISPAGAAVWEVGSRELITWKTNGTISNVNLEYSEDDFKNAVAIASAIANTGSFSWAVPNLDSKNLKIRVTDSTNTRVFAETRPGIKIQGKLTLTGPQGGEVWMVGSRQSITWESLGRIGQVRLEYTTDNFQTSLPIAAALPNTGSYVWEIPDDISRGVRVRLTSIDDPAVRSQSEHPLEIAEGIQLTSPSGGEVWQVAGRYAITWNSIGTIPQVRLEYSRDDFRSDINVIEPGLANKGIYYWEVPAISGNDFKIRVSDPSNPSAYDVSRGAFKVAGSLELLYPNWGETLKVGDRVDIQWKATPNIAQVKLEYSFDQFVTTKVISAAVANNGKFFWTVPDDIGEGISLRISDAQNQSVFAVTKAPFRIAGGFRLDSPAGDEVWPVGSDQTITWTSFGTISSIRLEYSEDDFATSLPMTAKAVNTGRFVWLVPDMTQKHIKIRISDIRDLNVQAISEGSLTVTGTLQLIAPAGGEKWVASEERIIRWQGSGFIPKVVLEYSKDNFSKDIYLIASDVHNVGSYFWRVPNDLSNNVKIRVRSQEDTSVFAVSALPFEIGRYKVTWVVRDSVTKDHLAGISITDSTGKTESALSSPVTLEYPYGIFTTSWSKPGYQELRSTWLADQDKTFSVYLEPALNPVETPRVNFEYDPEKDLMKVTSWFEKDGKSVPAVMESEVRIYDESRLVKTLRSATPDSRGYFRMIWDTSGVAGNHRYLASATVHTASGAALASPISYQLDIPVKESRPVESKPKMDLFKIAPKAGDAFPDKSEIASSQPSATPRNDSRDVSLRGAGPVSLASDEAISRPSKPSQPAPKLIESKLIVPAKAALGEAISITYVAEANVRPAVDIYDSNNRSIVSGRDMTPGKSGQFSFLLPIRGIAFIPGKAIHVTVIERKTGNFKSASIQIESAGDALGYNREAGNTTVLELIYSLGRLADDLEQFGQGKISEKDVLKQFELTLNKLASSLTAESLNPAVMENLNEVAEKLSKLITTKGVDGSYLMVDPLGESASAQDVGRKLRELHSAITILYRIEQNLSTGGGYS